MSRDHLGGDAVANALFDCIGFLRGRLNDLNSPYTREQRVRLWKLVAAMEEMRFELDQMPGPTRERT